MIRVHVCAVVLASLGALALSGCGGGPSAGAICAALKVEGVADKCAPATSTAAGAKEQVNFQLVGKHGKRGEIVTFGSDDETDAAAKVYKGKYASSYVKWSPRKRFLVYADMPTSDEQVLKFQQVLHALNK